MHWQIKRTVPYASPEQLKPLEDALNRLYAPADSFKKTIDDLTKTISVELTRALEQPVETIGAAIMERMSLETSWKTFSKPVKHPRQRSVPCRHRRYRNPDRLAQVADLGQIFNREGGGAVSANRPYIVGEREPELFVPNSAGTIYNQDQMRAAMSTYSSSSESAVLDRPMTINVETTTINGMEFVTPEQFRKGTEDAAMRGAKMGEQRAMNRLRQSRSTRSKLGM